MGKQIEAGIKKIVNEYGWYVAIFETTAYLPSFAYTIGLWKNFKHPELIVFGLTNDTLHSILNVSGDLVKKEKVILANSENADILENNKVFILEVNPENLSDYFGYGIDFYKGQFPAYQIVWADRKQKFPWEENFEKEFTYRQPLLDRNVDFKFREDKNLGVITNRQFLEEGKPILYVEHDDNGDWTFLTGDELLSSDARLICLEDMVELDQSLNQLFNLDYGEFAQRKSKKHKWERGK